MNGGICSFLNIRDDYGLNYCLLKKTLTYCDGSEGRRCICKELNKVKGKDHIMDNNMLEKTMDTIGNATKIVANLTDTKKVEKSNPKPIGQVDDDSNKANQNIQIRMDTGKRKEPKPVEKHIHEFPENRPLTELECELALKRAQMDYELKKSEQQFNQQTYNREWEHKLAVERKNSRKELFRRIVAGCFAALGVGAVCYGVYSDYKHGKAGTVSQRPETLSQGSGTVSPIKAEGEVK